MKTIADYIKAITESEGAVNTMSSGAIATKDVPLGKIAKRKEVKESDAYEGDNPLANNIGKFPLATGATAPSADGVTCDDSDEDKKHAFHLKQNYQNDQVMS